MNKLTAGSWVTREERKNLLKKNDWIAAIEVFIHWAWIAIAFALVWFWTNPMTVIIALFILGGKQLACAILMHDASHQSVFNNRHLNDLVGNWLGGYPIFQEVQRYRPYHYQHHVTTGTEEDPDLLLTRGYPTSRKSMIRKIVRDLTGQTGVKAFAGLILIHLGYLKYNLGGKVERVSQKDRTWAQFFHVFLKNLGGPILANMGIFLILYLVSSPWLYLLWIGAYMTTFQFSLRIRSIAEHSVVEDSTDPLRNTRTTKANWLERMLFAPYHVNYHLEHHMLMAVPSYHLPQLHGLLKERGFYKLGLLEPGYWSVVKLATRE